MRTFIRKADRLTLELLWSLRGKSASSAIDFSESDLAWFRAPIRGDK